MKLRSWIKDSTIYQISKEVYPPRKYSPLIFLSQDQNVSILWFLVDAAYKMVQLFLVKNT